jgi:hypothetical protein
MRGAVVVSANLNGIAITAGEEALTLYQFGTLAAKHYFCSKCGIYTHHQRRSNPNQFCRDSPQLGTLLPVMKEGSIDLPEPDANLRDRLLRGVSSVEACRDLACFHQSQRLAEMSAKLLQRFASSISCPGDLSYAWHSRKPLVLRSPSHRHYILCGSQS